MATALFLLDAALDAVMLGLAVRLAGQRIRAPRLLLGALLGAAMAALVRRAQLSRAACAWLWLPGALAMMAAALGRRALKRPLRHAALLLSAAGLLGGTMLALAGATGSLAAAYALGGACAAAMTACVLHAPGRSGAGSVQIACLYRGRTARFAAMADSGNTLRDSLTGYPVIVMPEAAGRRLFALENEALRPILADTAGGRQTMRLLVPQRTLISAHGLRRSVRAAVALSAALADGAPILAPASLLDQTE